MSRRLLSTLAVGLILLAGCSSENKGTADTPPDPAEPTSAPEKFTSFADFPGPHLRYTNYNETLASRVKPVDMTWVAELNGKAARPGFHFLAVYVAVTPDLADRGLQGVRLYKLAIRRPAVGECDSSTTPAGEVDTSACFVEGRPNSQLQQVADGEWRRDIWIQKLTGTDVKAGETLIGVVGFEIADTVAVADFKLCAPTPEHPLYASTYPCIPLAAPARS